MKLISGTSNRALAQRIAAELHVPLADVEINRFIDNECRVYVKDDMKGEEVFVIQSLSQIADQHLVELCLIGQAVKGLGANHVTAVIPWMGYSKQDKEFRRGEAVSAQLVAKFIEAAGYDRVVTLELHSENLVPYFTIPVVELSTHELLATALKEKISFDGMMVVSPDTGGQTRSDLFAKTVGLPIVYLEKKRDLVTGKVDVVGASDSVKGNNLIIFDDIINTGSTAIKTSEFLVSQGAGKIYFLATHPVLAGDASQRLSADGFDAVIVTDTILVPPVHQFAKLTIVSVSSLLTRAISPEVE